MQFSRPTLVLVVLYLALIVGVSTAMWIARSSIVENYSTVSAKADWQEWKEQTKREADGLGPVSRREAISNEPPAAVLMRDYFAVSFVAVVTMFSLIYLTFAFLLVGSLKRTQKSKVNE